MDADTFDPDLSRWILDFLLQQHVESHILASLLRVFPLPKDSLLLKKSLLLGKIEAEVTNGVVSEKVLTLLEQMEELEPLGASDAMRSAYCAVAVDCTVRLLRNSNNDVKGEYFEALKRIWRKRVVRVENFGGVGLISEELLEWKDALEAAIWDESVCENLVKRSEGIRVAERIMGYVKEENERFEKSFIEFVFESLKANGDDAARGVLGLGENEESEQCIGKAQTLPSGGKNVDNSNSTGEVQERTALRRRKHVANRRTRGLIPGSCRGAKISDVDDVEDGPSTSKYDVLTTPEVKKVQETLESSRLELHAVVKDPLSEALRVADAVISGKASETRHEAVREDQNRVNPPVTENVETAQANPDRDDQNRVNPSVTKNAEIAQAKPVEDEQNRVNPSVTENTEFAQSRPVGEDQNRVNPSVTKNAEIAQAKPVGDDQNRVNPSITRNAEIAQTKPVGDDQNRVNPSVTKNAEIAQAKPVGNDQNRVNNSEISQSRPVTENGEDTRSNGGVVDNDPIRHQANAPKPSLMERNNTARTFEWDDSLDGSQEKSSEGQTRPHLPSARRRPVSPLNIYKPAKVSKRRKIKRWSALEEETLRTGVDKFGRGNWKIILQAYSSIFDERTEVDLKDKWRNMLKYIKR